MYLYIYAYVNTRTINKNEVMDLKEKSYEGYIKVIITL